MLAQMVYFFKGIYLDTCGLGEGMGETLSGFCFCLPIFLKVSVAIVSDAFFSESFGGPKFLF